MKKRNFKNGDYTKDIHLPNEEIKKILSDNYYNTQMQKADICVNEKIDIMIDDNYTNCLQIADKNIKTLYFRDVRT